MGDSAELLTLADKLMAATLRLDAAEETSELAMQYRDARRLRTPDRSGETRLEIDASGMGIIWRVVMGDVAVWTYAAIEGPWPSAESLLRALWPDRMDDPFEEKT